MAQEAATDLERPLARRRNASNDLTRRFPLIVETLARLRSRSCIIDGETVACDDNGVASFDLNRHHRANESIFLYGFNLIELNGDDLRINGRWWRARRRKLSVS
jgi:ATP-dependent DNA ligase